MDEPDEVRAGVNTAVPNGARIYDYLLGGKDNYEADRQAWSCPIPPVSRRTR